LVPLSEQLAGVEIEDVDLPEAAAEAGAGSDSHGATEPSGE